MHVRFMQPQGLGSGEFTTGKVSHHKLQEAEGYCWELR